MFQTDLPEHERRTSFPSVPGVAGSGAKQCHETSAMSPGSQHYIHSDRYGNNTNTHFHEKYKLIQSKIGNLIAQCIVNDAQLLITNSIMAFNSQDAFI